MLVICVKKQLSLKIFRVCQIFFYEFSFVSVWWCKCRKSHFPGIMVHTVVVGPKHNTAVSNANGFHWFRRQTSITGWSTNKHMLVLNVSDPFFRERIMSHGHHFPHQNVTTILSWRVARKALVFSGARPSVCRRVWVRERCLLRRGRAWRGHLNDVFRRFCESQIANKLCQPTES